MLTWIAVNCWCFICGLAVGYLLGRNRRRKNTATHGELKVTKD